MISLPCAHSYKASQALTLTTAPLTNSIITSIKSKPPANFLNCSTGAQMPTFYAFLQFAGFLGTFFLCSTSFSRFLLLVFRCYYVMTPNCVLYICLLLLLHFLHLHLAYPYLLQNIYAYQKPYGPTNLAHNYCLWSMVFSLSSIICILQKKPM